MKKILLTTAALAVMATSAMAQTVIAVGQEGRGYEAFGKDMVKALAGKIDATTKNYEGSDAISRAVCDGEAQVGIMQIDAIYTRQKEGCKLRVVGTYGTEFAYLLAPEDSDIGELADLTASSKLLVDTVGSGTELFWSTIRAIETGPDGNQSGWEKAIAVNDPIFLAQTMAEVGDIDAVLIVGTTTSKDVAELIGAGWQMLSIYDKDINDQLFNGAELYPVGDASVAGTGGWLSGDTSNDSYAIRSFVVVSEELSKDRRAFKDVADASVSAAAKKAAK